MKSEFSFNSTRIQQSVYKQYTFGIKLYYYDLKGEKLGLKLKHKA